MSGYDELTYDENYLRERIAYLGTAHGMAFYDDGESGELLSKELPNLERETVFKTVQHGLVAFVENWKSDPHTYMIYSRDRGYKVAVDIRPDRNDRNSLIGVIGPALCADEYWDEITGETPRYAEGLQKEINRRIEETRTTGGFSRFFEVKDDPFFQHIFENGQHTTSHRIIEVDDEKPLHRPIDEASLSRIWQHNKAHDCAAMTAFRKARDCGEGKPYTKKENIARNRSLLAKIQSQGYDATRILGKYPEDGTTQKEVSFFIVDPKDTGRLEEDLRNWGEMFEQDSVLFIPQGAINNDAEAYLIGTNRCPNSWIGYGDTEAFERGRLGHESPIYTSYVNGRPFIFEEVDRHEPTPGNGYGWWMLRLMADKHWTELIGRFDEEG